MWPCSINIPAKIPWKVQQCGILQRAAPTFDPPEYFWGVTGMGKLKVSPSTVKCVSLIWVSLRGWFRGKEHQKGLWWWKKGPGKVLYGGGGKGEVWRIFCASGKLFHAWKCPRLGWMRFGMVEGVPASGMMFKVPSNPKQSMIPWSCPQWDFCGTWSIPSCCQTLPQGGESGTVLTPWHRTALGQEITTNFSCSPGALDCPIQRPALQEAT